MIILIQDKTIKKFKYILNINFLFIVKNMSLNCSFLLYDTKYLITIYFIKVLHMFYSKEHADRISNILIR